MESSEIPPSNTLGPIVFKSLVNDLGEGVEGIVVKFTDYIKLEGMANALEPKEKIQKDLNRLEQWPNCTG